MTDNNLSNDSICCGSPIINGDFCSDCREHTEPVRFEDADGNESLMAADREGTLRDIELFNQELKTRAYREPLEFKPTVKEFAGFVGCVLGFFSLFAIALMFGGGK